MVSKRHVAVTMTVALVALSGCSGLLGGGGGGGGSGSITIATESAQGGGEYIYVQSGGGLPKGTNITATVSATVQGKERTISTYRVLNQSVPAGTKVYLGGEGGTGQLPVTIGENPPTDAAIGGSNSNTGTFDVTITVDTGDNTVEKTFTFGSSN